MTAYVMAARSGAAGIDVRKELFTPEEISASNFRVTLSCELIEARNRGLTKDRLAELTGVSKSSLSRIERCDPISTDTVLKVLFALGKTLYIDSIKTTGAE